MAYTKAEYLETFKMMAFSRECSLVIEEYAMKGMLPGFQHPGIGDEGVMVGVFSELGENDWIVPQHRNRPMVEWRTGCQGLYIREIIGKSSGLCGGMSGDSHFFSKEHKLGPYSGFLGQAQAIATGIAMQYKMDKVDGCVVIGCGDGTLNEGVVSEALNMIAAWKLPVVWYVQNNGWSIASRFEDVTGLKDLAQRAQGFGIPSSSYDGTDVLLVKEVMREATAKARKGEPSLVEFRTTRWTGHFLGDPQQLYRDMGEVAFAKTNKDPVKWNREFLISHSIATAEELDTITNEQHAFAEKLMLDALASPDKTREDVIDLSKVYAPF